MIKFPSPCIHPSLGNFLKSSRNVEPTRKPVITIQIAHVLVTSVDVIIFRKPGTNRLYGGPSMSFDNKTSHARGMMILLLVVAEIHD